MRSIETIRRNEEGALNGGFCLKQPEIPKDCFHVAGGAEGNQDQLWQGVPGIFADIEANYGSL